MIDLIEQAIEHENQTFTHDGLEVTFTNEPKETCKLRIIAPLDRNDNGELRTLAYDLITTLLSETTNDDACDVTIRERSAHFDLHDDLPEHIRTSDFAHYVVIDAEVHDALT